MQIIQNKKYRLLVGMGYMKVGEVLEVKRVDGDNVSVDIIGVSKPNFSCCSSLPLTTFIHCVEPVEESTYDKVSKAADKSCDAAWEKFENDYLDDKPKEEWPKVRDTYWYIDTSQVSSATWDSQDAYLHKNGVRRRDVLGSYRTKEKAQEALEKMKAIARELSGK